MQRRARPRRYYFNGRRRSHHSSTAIDQSTSDRAAHDVLRRQQPTASRPMRQLRELLPHLCCLTRQLAQLRTRGRAPSRAHQAAPRSGRGAAAAGRLGTPPASALVHPAVNTTLNPTSMFSTITRWPAQSRSLTRGKEVANPLPHIAPLLPPRDRRGSRVATAAASRRPI
ncbi:hypothetical protein T492DRAFT_943116 [Pavlovales sp. CCMP2436]|nr:hypothetical protein T492DRAFT_943116 [Pavlovales sp. CCMP2436]